MSTPPRGAILKCRFPFDSDPQHAGPTPHYCLFADRMVGQDGRSVLVVAYGTSRLDEDLLKVHKSGNGVLSIDSRFVKGPMPGSVTHFLARHVAVIPSTWAYSSFQARLDFIRPESREGDQYRQNLYRSFLAFEEAMDSAAVAALDYFLNTGRVGLQPGKYLRPRR